MENRSVYEIVSGMSGEGYCSVVRTASGLSRWFGVIERSNPDHYLPVVQRLLNDLVPYLSDIEQVRSWPGTQVVGSRTETRLLFDVTPESVEMVLRSSSCFWDWANTDYPDDLHFLRSDKSTVLGSTWCTQFAWLELDSEELRLVKSRISQDVSLSESEVSWE